MVPPQRVARSMETAPPFTVRPLVQSRGTGETPRVETGLDALLRSMERVDHHDHLCLIYETQEEQFAAALPYIRLGLERGEQCIYIADDNTSAQVLDAMREYGLPVDAALASGQLVMATKREAYLKDGTFDPDGMVRFLRTLVEQAQATGWSGLRVTGEMTWALDGSPGCDRLMEYECRLNEFFPDYPVSAICQYNAKRFDPAVIREVILTHPLVIHGGVVCHNFYYVPPAEFLHPDRSAQEVDRLLRNVVERNQAEETLRRLKDDLERCVQERTAELITLNRELESFSYSVSHDLRAPLRGIDYFSQVLLEDYRHALDDAGQEHLLRVRRECQRMTQLVNDLLTLSRAVQGEMRRETLDLSSCATAVLDELRRGSPGRIVETHVTPGLEVTADAQLLRVVLENLLGNAWKYTSRVEKALLEVGATVEDGHVVYFIRDNGAGFDMAKADRLFGAFQRLHSTSEFEGTGIGLATVKRILQRHGGRIWAEGRVGEGATFYFTLAAPGLPKAA